MVVLEKIKNEFSFLENSDEYLLDIINNHISETETEEDIDEEIYDLIREYIQQENNITVITNYIDKNMDCEEYHTALESLNNFSKLLDNIKLPFTEELYEKIKEETTILDKALNIITTNFNKKKLNETSLEILKIYSRKNNIEISSKEYEKELSSVFSSDSVKAYLDSINKIPLLTPEEEYKLTKEYQKTKDKTIRDKIIKANLRLVASIAKDVYYKTRGVSYLDLIEAGNFGLFRALEDYNPDEAKFSTYATNWIKQKIYRDIQNNSRTIRVSVKNQENMLAFKKEKKRLETKMHKELSVKELAALTNISEELIRDYEANYNITVSLNSTVNNEKEAELIDFIADPNQEEYNRINDKLKLQQLLSQLTQEEKTIILLRSGLYDGVEYTLVETAKKLHELGIKERIISGERVRQKETKIKEKMLQELKKELTTKTITNEANISDYFTKIKLKKLSQKLQELNSDTIITIMEELPINDRAKIYKCFGNNLFEGQLKEKVYYEDKCYVAEVVYPKILRIIRKIDKEEEKGIIKKLPKNIYLKFSHCNKEEVDRAVDSLTTSQRILFSRYYDIYTGEYNDKLTITTEEKRKLISVIISIKDKLPKQTKKHSKTKKKERL